MVFCLRSVLDADQDAPRNNVTAEAHSPGRGRTLRSATDQTPSFIPNQMTTTNTAIGKKSTSRYLRFTAPGQGMLLLQGLILQVYYFAAA